MKNLKIRKIARSMIKIGQEITKLFLFEGFSCVGIGFWAKSRDLENNLSVSSRTEASYMTLYLDWLQSLVT